MTETGDQHPEAVAASQECAPAEPLAAPQVSDNLLADPQMWQTVAPSEMPAEAVQPPAEQQQLGENICDDGSIAIQKPD